MADLLPDMGEIAQVVGMAVAYGLGGYMLVWGIGHIGWVVIDSFKKGV